MNSLLLIAKRRNYRIPLFGWHDDGWLTMCNGNTNNHHEVIIWYSTMMKQGFRIKEIRYDRRFGEEYIENSKKNRQNVVDQPQLYTKTTKGFNRIDKMSEDGNIYYCQSEAFEYCVKNVMVTEKVGGFKEFHKVGENKRIDIFAAAVFAATGIGAKLIYNDEWEIRVYPTQTPAIEKSLTNAKFQFIVKAPFPYWNRIEGSRTLLSQIEPVFQFPWDLSLPYFQFGGRKEGMFGNVFNEGDIDAPYRVIFTALDELSNPSLTNVVTHEYLRIMKKMSVGEVVTIDISSFGISVVSNIAGLETDVFGSLDIDSNLYRIHSGDNVIKYDAEPNRSGLDVTILYHALKVGAYD